MLGIIIPIVLILFCIGLGIYIWKNERKTGYLDDEYGIVEYFSQSIKDGLKKAIIFVVLCIILLLSTIGGSVLNSINSAWGTPITLMIIIITLITIIYLILLPLIEVMYASSLMCAVTFNNYIKENYPLDYYRSKRQKVRIYRHKFL